MVMAVGFPDLEARPKAVVNPLKQECGAGKQRLSPRLRAQVSCATQGVGYGFADWKAAGWGHGLLRLRERWVAEQGIDSGWNRAGVTDGASGTGGGQVVGQRQNGLPPQTAQHLVHRTPDARTGCPQGVGIVN